MSKDFSAEQKATKHLYKMIKEHGEFDLIDEVIKKDMSDFHTSHFLKRYMKKQLKTLIRTANWDLLIESFRADYHIRTEPTRKGG